MTAAPYDFELYGEGLCFASVCTSLTDEQAAARMFPSGTRLGWRISDQPFNAGRPTEVANGSPCPERPETHRHLLFEC